MAVEIHSGDIFDVKSQGLVVPGNCQADFNWSSHITERIRKLADPSVLQERKEIGDIQLGEACLTKGKGTGFEYLLHAAVLDKFDFNPLFLLRIRQRTSDETLIRSLQSVKKIVRENDLESIAVSAMGAGIGGMNYRKCVKLTFSELKDLDCRVIFAAFKSKHVAIARKELEML